MDELKYIVVGVLRDGETRVYSEPLDATAARERVAGYYLERANWKAWSFVVSFHAQAVLWPESETSLERNDRLRKERDR